MRRRRSGEGEEEEEEEADEEEKEAEEEEEEEEEEQEEEESINAGRVLGLNNPPAWMDTSTCSMLLVSGFHISDPFPCQVCSRLRHTLPVSYRLGLTRSPNEW